MLLFLVWVYMLYMYGTNTVTPHTLSPSVIRNLGATFCNLDEESLTAPVLNKKKLPATPGGKKQIKKKPSNKNNEDDKNQKKKPKKGSFSHLLFC